MGREGDGLETRRRAGRTARRRGVVGAIAALLMTMIGVACTKPDKPEAGQAALPLAAQSSSAAVTGTVTYRERVMLPPSAMLTVRLTDVSKQDVAGMVLAEQVISPVQVPAAFRLAYDPAQIDSVHTYVIQARIEDSGTIRFINMEQYRVLTRGAPMDGVEVLVQAVK